jgi:5,10-methenyltetrahydrofolate synthetase
MGPAEPSGDHAGDSVPFRERLRRDRIAARLAMTDDEYQRASAQIAALLKSVLAARRPQAIGFCWPVRREFDARPLVSELIDGGWRACQPVVVTPAAPMQFRGWTPDAPMTTDRHGIPIPDTSRCTAPDVLLLPLVAFDGEGYRIGYGGGYFDRTLATLRPRPLTIGVGFELGRIETTRPQAHDIRLDMIVTEAGTWTFASAVGVAGASCVTLTGHPPDHQEPRRDT